MNRQNDVSRSIGCLVSHLSHLALILAPSVTGITVRDAPVPLHIIKSRSYSSAAGSHCASLRKGGINNNKRTTTTTTHLCTRGIVRWGAREPWSSSAIIVNRKATTTAIFLILFVLFFAAAAAASAAANSAPRSLRGRGGGHILEKMNLSATK